MPRVLLTGANGFVGGACARLLSASGFEIVAMSRRPTSHTVSAELGDSVRWIYADMLDTATVDAAVRATRATHLVHAAWHPVHGDVMSSPRNWDWLSASEALVRAFVEAGGQRAALLGSCAEYDWSQGVCRIGETPYQPASAYGAAKCALRTRLESYARISGLSLVWARPFFVYGAGEHPSRLVASVISALREKRPALVTHGRQVRDYLHVDDVAAGVLASLVAHHEGAVDLASGQPTQLGDIVTEIARQMGREDLVVLGAIPARPGEPPIVLGDPGPARNAIGWQPRISLRDGLANTIEAVLDDAVRAASA